MAVVKTGSIVTDIRGSVGDETYSRNQGGIYVRTRKGPGGTPTAKQTAITDAMSDLSQAWSDTLTEAQRSSWRQYANEHPRPNRWGTKLCTNGYTRFIAVNFPEYVRTSAILRSSAPTAPPIRPPQFAFTILATGGQITVTLPLTIPLPSTGTFRVYLYVSPWQSQGINYYSAPFQYKSTNLKTSGTWGTSPWNVPVSTPTSGDIKFFARLRAQDTATGAISTIAQANAIQTIIPPP